MIVTGVRTLKKKKTVVMMKLGMKEKTVTREGLRTREKMGTS